MPRLDTVSVPFFLKNGDNSKVYPIQLIFKEEPLTEPNWVQETHRIGQMTSFRMQYHLNIWEKVLGL